MVIIPYYGMQGEAHAPCLVACYVLFPFALFYELKIGSETKRGEHEESREKRNNIVSVCVSTELFKLLTAS